MTTNTSLYEQDYYLWLENTAKLIRKGKFYEVDVANLIEELEDMGKSEKRAIESNLVVMAFSRKEDTTFHRWIELRSISFTFLKVVSFFSEITYIATST